MLTLLIPEGEYWDPSTETFLKTKSCKVQLEHSLRSIHKWESKWKLPYLSAKNKTDEQAIDYIRCMLIAPKDVPEWLFSVLPSKVYETIFEYCSDPMTATTFNDRHTGRGSIITAEIVYWWMTELNIPFECDKWHFNQLMALIKTCSMKKEKPKKMSRRSVMEQNAALNKQRRARRNTKG